MNPVSKVVVTDVRRPALDDLDALAEHGVATVHEAAGRSGFLGPDLVARVPGSRVAGSVVTAVCWPGDNLMIHAAVEQCRDGDVLLVTTTSPCTDGLFGELLATSLLAHGVRGAVLTTGVRDVADLRKMPFPVWSRAVSAQGTVKDTAGAVNVPVAVGGVIVRPGDALVADDDGVVAVARADIGAVLKACAAREDREAATREALAGGQLGLDRYSLRPLLEQLGVRYLREADYQNGESR
jgi:4-hydroxy-4-methyl-2-oxoglutarate aldolase